MKRPIVEGGPNPFDSAKSDGYWASVTKNRARNPYELLKGEPALSLASERRDRPDVRCTVILGYN